MDAGLRWLNGRPRVALVSLFIYVPFIVLSHNLVQRQVRALRDAITRPLFNVLMLGIVLLALVGLTVWILRASRGMAQRDHRIRAWVIALAGTFVSYLYLVVQFSESVHYPQYAVLAVVLFALTRSYGDTFLLITIISLIDEGYQFWYLRAHLPSYFDFNDTLLNQVGALLGLALVFGTSRTFPVRARERSWRAELHRSWALRLSAALFVVCAIGWAAGLLQRYPGERETTAWVLLDKRNDRPPGFWRPGGRGADKPFHLVTHTEGPLLTLALLAGMLGIDRPRRRLVTQPGAASMGAPNPQHAGAPR